MIAQAFVNIAFVKIYQRFGDAATRTGEAGEHFKWAIRLVSFQMMVTVI